MRRNLVVVRAGTGSLHAGWLAGPESRTWDLVVSCYEPCPPEASSDVVQMFQPGGKWDGLYSTLNAIQWREKYDYIWLPDDDIRADVKTINAIFEQMRHYSLRVGQPSLAPGSEYTHYIFNQCSGFRIRFSNFIEIMVPCLRADALALVLPLFKGSMSGFGLDYIWCRLGEGNNRSSAIMDTISVLHSRPVGVHLQGKMALEGKTPQVEEAELRGRFDIPERPRPIAYAGYDRHGRFISNRVGVGFRMALSYLAALPFQQRKLRSLNKIVQVLRRQITKPLDLSPLALAGTYEPLNRQKNH
jgi:hypothetical protein